MTERLDMDDDPHVRRRRRLAQQLRGLRVTLGPQFTAAWRKARDAFEANKVHWEEGKVPSPYSLEEPDDVRRVRLDELRVDPHGVNCRKLYQALQKVKHDR